MPQPLTSVRVSTKKMPMRAVHRHILPLAVVLALPTGIAGAAGFLAGTEDRPLKIIQTTDVRPNYGMRADVPTTGDVQLAILVDEDGRLLDMLLLGSTHRVFTDAAVAGLQQWRFEPAIQNGRPIGTRTVVRLSFSARGRVVSVQGGEVLAGMTEGFVRRYDRRLAPARELDRPLRATEAPSPGFPVSLLGRIPSGERVVVDLYIDETGRPRMPVVVESAHPLLSAAALAALDRWRFEPPTRDGQPVVVRAKQEFVFRATGAAAS